MTWKRWFTSLLNAAVSGAAMSFIAAGIGLTPVQIAKLAGGAALVSAVKWYLQHPPPGVEVVETKKQSLETDLGNGQVAVSTVEKTTITPAVKP